MNNKKIKVGIVGANGYAGAEVLRLIAGHPFAELCVVTSRAHLGKRVSDVFPALPCDLAFSDVSDAELKKCDVVFTALPQVTGFELVGKLIDAGVRVIDLSADYRFDDVTLYEKTYAPHPRHDLNDLAVYGLCEHNREKIRTARLVANPGCYVTSVLLPMLPLCKAELATDIIIDSKSGVSGAGRKSDEAYGFCALDESFKAYGVFTHRHAPEISEKLGESVVFTPHLLPLKRGILSTVYFKTSDCRKALDTIKTAYKDDPVKFAEYLEALPEISTVAYTNRCVFSARFDEKSGRGIVVSVIDNLLKGAAGQAVQNMNIMFGFAEDEALPRYSPV